MENTPEDPENTVFTDDTLPGQTNYQSPFGNPTCCSLIDYIIDNTTTDLVLEFVPYVGLARFDGAYDTQHFQWGIPLNTTNYPNLLLDGQEYFKLVECNLVSVAPGITDMEQYVQLPIGPGQYFTIAPPSTGAEWTILNEYGKLYAIDAIIKDTSGNIVASELLRFPFLVPPATHPSVGVSGFLPMPSMGFPEQNDLWYHQQTLEICVGSDPVYFHTGGDGLSGRPSELNFNYNGTPRKLSLSTNLTSVNITLQ